jgi:hypothetical protein
VTKDMDGERDDHYDEEEDRSQHSGDVKGGAVFLSGRRRGDAEEVNETGGDVSEESHGSWMRRMRLGLQIYSYGSWNEKCNRRRECASIFAVLAAATVGAYTYRSGLKRTRRTPDVDRNSNPYP